MAGVTTEAGSVNRNASSLEAMATAVRVSTTTVGVIERHANNGRIPDDDISSGCDYCLELSTILMSISLLT